MTDQIRQALAAREYERALRLADGCATDAATASEQAELFELQAQALSGMQRWSEAAAARVEQSRCLRACEPVEWNRVFQADYATAYAWNQAGEHERSFAAVEKKLDRIETLTPRAAGDWCGLAAIVRSDEQRFSEAAEYRAAQLDYYERSEPRDAAAVAVARNALAWACYLARDLDRALEAVRVSRAAFSELYGASDRRTLSALHLHIYILNLLGEREPQADHHAEMLRLCEELVSRREAGAATREEIDDARRWLASARKKAAAGDAQAAAGDAQAAAVGARVAEWHAAKERAAELFSRGELGPSLAALRTGLSVMTEFLEARSPEPGDAEADAFWARYFDHRSDLHRLAANVSTHLLYSGEPFDAAWDPASLAERDLEAAWRFRKPSGVKLSIRVYVVLLSKLHVALWRAELHRTGRAGGSAEALTEAQGLLSAVSQVGEQLPDPVRSDVVLLDAERAYAELRGDRRQAASYRRRVEAWRAVLEEEHRLIGTPRAPVIAEPGRRRFGGGR